MYQPESMKSRFLTMYGIKRKRTEGNKIIDDGKEKAREILTKYRPALDVISKKLFEVETLEREEYEVLLKLPPL